MAFWENKTRAPFFTNRQYSHQFIMNFMLLTKYVSYLHHRNKCVYIKVKVVRLPALHSPNRKVLQEVRVDIPSLSTAKSYNAAKLSPRTQKHFNSLEKAIYEANSNFFCIRSKNQSKYQQI